MKKLLMMTLLFASSLTTVCADPQVTIPVFFVYSDPIVQVTRDLQTNAVNVTVENAHKKDTITNATQNLEAVREALGIEDHEASAYTIAELARYQNNDRKQLQLINFQAVSRYTYAIIVYCPPQD